MNAKRRRFWNNLSVALAVNCLSSSILWAEPSTSPPSSSTVNVQSGYGRLPLYFEANQGQWDHKAQFVTRGPAHQLFLTLSDAVLALRTGETRIDAGDGEVPQHWLPDNSSPASYSLVRMAFKGAGPNARMAGLDKLPGIVNYLIGGDPSKWLTNIPTYQKVEYNDVYPGIDLVYYGNHGQLEYDFIVAPGADPKQIKLAFEGVDTIEVDEGGDLILSVPETNTGVAGGQVFTLRMHKPVVYQRDAHGGKHLLAGTYVLVASQPSDRSASVALESIQSPHVAFQVASYDASQPLIIDPVLSWATYLGGNAGDEGIGIAVDHAGQAYVTGHTRSPNFPTTAGAFQTTLDSTSNAFVTKLNATGTALVYSTYLGGSGNDIGSGIAVDQAGQAYVTGTTDTPGSGFPGTAGSLIQSSFGGGFRDAFVTKLNVTGTALIYSTYLGGSGEDGGLGIAVDQAGQAYVTGSTNTPGSGFPGTAGSLIQSAFAGGSDVFVAKLNAAGTALHYATYLGGSDGDSSGGIAVNQAGEAYVTGSTNSPNFPTTVGAFQSTFAGRSDVFVAKLNAAGTALRYATYLGGSGSDSGRGIAVDQAGSAYVTGRTDTPGSGFPGTASSLIQRTCDCDLSDAFVTKLNASGTALLYSTYLGGSLRDSGTGIAVDGAGQAYVTGDTTTQGSGFPGTAGSSVQSTNAGGLDTFVTKLNAAGTALVYSTYLGGSGPDVSAGIAVDGAGNAYITGDSPSPNFPGAAGSQIQSTFAGGFQDAFVAKISSDDSPSCSAAQATPSMLWSPNHEFVPVIVTGVTDPDGDAVTITVTSVTQDEPVNAKGDGNTSPDAVIQAGAASVRAERSGKGNGRVYQLSFRAEDAKGGFCTGAVTVSVPHSMQTGLTAIDDGQIYDSTVQ